MTPPSFIARPLKYLRGDNFCKQGLKVPTGKGLKVPIIKRAPRRKIGHWLPYYFNNSAKGLAKTADEGINWHDWDFGITKNGWWRIGHGNPEKVLLKTGRMRDYTYQVVDTLRYRGFSVGRPSPLFKYAKRRGVNIEIEPKGYDLRYTNPRYWNSLANLCIKVYGPGWHKHYYVKISDDHGVEFAVRVLRAASSVGFTAGPLRNWDVPDKYL